MKCPYCNHYYIYTLSTGQNKCAKCLKKFSMKKIQRDKEIVSCFCEDMSAKECAKNLNLNYVTVKSKYELFRKIIASFLEEEYQGQISNEYDEYIYLPKTKKKVQKNIFDAQNFLTFSFKTNKVYNLLMPNLNRFKQELLDDELDELYFKEFSKFMMWNKISKVNKHQKIIREFWHYFEKFILKYKGIANENFIYYLKECEFKFNYNSKQRVEIILNLLK